MEQKAREQDEDGEASSVRSSSHYSSSMGTGMDVGGRGMMYDDRGGVGRPGGAGLGAPPTMKYDFESMGVGYTGYDQSTTGSGGVDGDDTSMSSHQRKNNKRGRPRKRSFEASDSDRGGGAFPRSSDEEEEVDWEDSAEEDMDAATAEAMEEARIGMARAAARDLRESRATR